MALLRALTGSMFLAAVFGGGVAAQEKPAAAPATGAVVPVVVELFTSQGCSSCPPADKLLGELAKRPGIVALTLSVDYWDYIGWRDTLAKPAHSARQKAYAEARGDRQVFTPQMVVNGRLQVAGSDPRAVEKAIAAAKADVPVPVGARVAGGILQVSLPSARPDGPGKAEVWALGVVRVVSVAIGRGENAGRSIDYHHVVRRIGKLGDWTGTPIELRRPVADLADAECDVIVLLVQGTESNHPGPIFGSSVVALR